jgi:hypothetical protein
MFYVFRPLVLLLYQRVKSYKEGTELVSSVLILTLSPIYLIYKGYV